MPKRTKEDRPLSDNAGRDAVRSVVKAVMQGTQAGDMLDTIDTLERLSDRPHEDLAWLAAYDVDRELAEAAFAVLYGVLSYEMEEKGEVAKAHRTAVLDVARRAVSSPRIPTDRKLRIGILVEACGGDPQTEAVLTEIANSPEARAQVLKDTVRYVMASRESAERFLAATGIISDFGGDEDSETRPLERKTVDLVMEVCNEIREEGPATAALLLGTLLVGAIEKGATDVGADAMAALSEYETPEARWCLDELARWPGLGEFAAQAGERAKRLEAAGIQPKLGMRSAFSHGLVTSVDGMGSRTLCLLFHTRDGGLDAVVFLLNDVVGVKDFWCLYAEGSDLEDQLRISNEQDQITLAYCPLSSARQLVADVWAIHEEAGTVLPAQFFLSRYLLGEEPILPERLEPDLSAYNLDRLTLSPDLFSGDLDDVLEFPPFTDLDFSSDKAYAFVAENAPPKSKNLSKAKRVKFAKEVAIHERETFLRRVAVNLEHEARAGHGIDEEIRSASRMYLGMRENVLPFHMIPLVQKLCDLSTEGILANLRQGFATQAEANAAAMEEAGLWDEEDSYDPLDDEDAPF